MSTPRSSSAGSGQRIAVVGGGISGLATAHLLEQLGHEVVVFEARERPGGRIHTTAVDGTPVEVGAARISDEHRRSLAWIDHCGLELEPMYPASGRLVRFGPAGRELGRDARWLSPHDVHQLVSHAADWPTQFGSLRWKTRSLITHGLTHATWYRIGGGNAQLPARIASRVNGAIHYGAVVRAIRHDGTQVRLSVDATGHRTEATFDRCVLAVPLTTLGRIDVRPALAETKRIQVRAMGAQPAVKTWFELAGRSWLDREGLNGFGCTHEDCEVWQPTFAARSTSSTVLVLYAQGQAERALCGAAAPGGEAALAAAAGVAGAAGAALAAGTGGIAGAIAGVVGSDAGHHEPTRHDAPDRPEIAQALGRLEGMFPGARSATRAAHAYSWTEDPWARGAQSLVHQRAPQLRSALAACEGRLHFAGEHTAGGWIDDALASAERVVAEIADG